MTPVKGPNKRAKGQGTITKRADGRYAGALWIQLPDDSRHRKWVYDDTESGVKKKLADLRNNRDAGKILAGKTMTLSTWLDHWHETSVAPELAPKTVRSYLTTANQYLKPSIGNVRLDKLTPDHVRKALKHVKGKGLSSRTVALTYQVLALALAAAYREQKVARNVTDMVKRPRTKKAELGTLTPVEAVKVLQTVAGDRLGSRIAAAFLTGARQGELLGLTWDRVTDSLNLSWQLQRFTWEHGCPKPCGMKRAADCPKRTVTLPDDYEHRHIEGGLWWSRPKSKAGWRIIPLTEPLATILERRREASACEENPHNLVWTQPNGKPIDPRPDNEYWHEALVRAGLEQMVERDGKQVIDKKIHLHAARHTTASLLHKVGVPMEVITKILGHSTAAMSEAYMSFDREQLTSAMKALSAGFELER